MGDISDDEELLRLIELQESRMDQSDKQRRQTASQLELEFEEDRDLDDAAGVDYAKLFRTRLVQDQKPQLKVSPVANSIQKQSIMLPSLRPSPQAVLWAYEQMRIVLEGEKILNWKNTMEVVWIKELQVGRVVSLKGNAIQSMGRFVQNQHYLLAEEVLFLLERGSLLLYVVEKNDSKLDGLVPLSVQDGYSLLLGGENLRWIDYTAYVHLRKNGYLVTRPSWGFKRLPMQAEHALGISPTEETNPTSLDATIEKVEAKISDSVPWLVNRHVPQIRRRTESVTNPANRHETFDLFKPGSKKSECTRKNILAKLFVISESEPFITADEVRNTKKRNENSELHQVSVICAIVSANGVSTTMFSCNHSGESECSL